MQEHAVLLSAWSVHLPELDAKYKSGVIIRNRSGAPFHDVEIMSTISSSNSDPVTELPMLSLTMLPPGEYVAVSEQRNWRFPQDRSEFGAVNPIWKNKGWAVTSIEFTDAHGIRWLRRGGALQQVASPVV